MRGNLKLREVDNRNVSNHWSWSSHQIKRHHLHCLQCFFMLVLLAGLWISFLHKRIFDINAGKRSFHSKVRRWAGPWTSFQNLCQVRKFLRRISILHFNSVLFRLFLLCRLMVGLKRLNSNKIRVYFFIFEFDQSCGCIFFWKVGNICKSEPIHFALDGDFLNLPNFSKYTLQLFLSDLQYRKRYYILWKVWSVYHIFRDLNAWTVFLLYRTIIRVFPQCWHPTWRKSIL